MPSRHNQAACLHHIVENCERAGRHIAGIDRDTFARDEVVRDAVERCVERVCEAAHRLGEAANLLMPGQPWGDIRGMGNRLRHAYDRIDVDIMWNTADLRLPELAVAARNALLQLKIE